VQQPLANAPEFEWIATDPWASFRWHVHDFPHPIARWNHHPECEIHLVRHSAGMVFIGDHVGEFGPGHFTMVGPDLPHHWVSDLAPGEVARNCHMVLQFAPQRLVESADRLPELAAVGELVERSRCGLEFRGETARLGGRLLAEIGQAEGLGRLAKFLELLDLLATTSEVVRLSSTGYVPNLDPRAQRIVNAVMDYVCTNLTEPLRMAQIAAIVGMSEPTFSRFFKRNTGCTFVEYVRKLRIAQACKLLAATDRPITDVCFDVGYANISNFNRCFLSEKGMTPSSYRKLMSRVATPA